MLRQLARHGCKRVSPRRSVQAWRKRRLHSNTHTGIWLMPGSYSARLLADTGTLLDRRTGTRLLAHTRTLLADTGTLLARHTAALLAPMLAALATALRQALRQLPLAASGPRLIQ